MKVIREWFPAVLVFSCILILGLFLRIYNLNELPVFADEAIYVRWSQVMRAEPSLRFLPLTDGKQPLFMWVTIPFLKVFSDPLIGGRMVSAATGAGIIFGVFILTYVLFNSKKVSLISSLIYAISPFAIFFDRMALADSMLSFFGIWTLIFIILAVKYTRLDMALLAGFALGGAMLTKSPAIFFVLMLPISLLIARLPSGIKNKLLLVGKSIFLLLVTAILGFGFYNILRLGEEFGQIGLRNQDYVFPLGHIITNPKDPFIFFVDRVREWIWILGPSTLIWLVIAGMGANIKKHRREVAILAVWAFFPILIQSEYAKVFTARYIFFSVPIIAAIAGSAFLANKKILNAVLGLFFVFFVFHSLFIDRLILTNVEAAPLPRGERSGYLEEWTAGEGIKDSARIIREEYISQPGRKIVIGTEGYFGTLPDGLQIYLNDLREITVIGVGLGINKVPDSLIESHKAGNKTYLLVNSSRFIIKESLESVGLRLIRSYPKAERPSEIKEFNQFGPRDHLYLFEIVDINKKGNK